jgi:hypothetical protein
VGRVRNKYELGPWEESSRSEEDPLKFKITLLSE